MKLRSVSILLMVLMVMSMCTVPVLASSEETISVQERQQMVNVAHRGASGHAPENTIAAFEKAVDMKADYFELDVQMTKDGKLIVIHDTTVDRTTNGTGSVGELTFEEIRKLDAGSWFSEKFAGEKVPSFEEVLDAYRGKIGILIELKSPALYPGIEKKVAEALKERNMHKANNSKIIIQSFNHESMQRSKELLPNIPHGVLAGMSWEDVTDKELAEFAVYADFFNPNMNILTPDLVERIHDAGMKTHPYTVRTPEQAERLFELNVDGIITDYPEYVDAYPGIKFK